MVELLMVADDLTGATDTGVQFADRGIPVRVVVHPAGALDAAGAGVLVVDTESRHVAPEEAALRVGGAVREGRSAGIRRFFKKTDSALRGNVGAELEALRSASGAAQVAFVPALPALGRTTRAGVQYIHGHPLHETDFAADPLDPVRERSVAALIRRQVDVPVTVLDCGALAAGPGARLPETGILVFDAGTSEDIREIVAWLGRRGLLEAVAGTAALARVLAEASVPARPMDVPPFRPPAPHGPMLVVGGSLNPVSLAQLDHAAAAGFATVGLSPDALVGGATDAAAADVEEHVAAAVHHLSRGRDVMLRCAAGRAQVAACLALGDQFGLDAHALHLRVAERTGMIVRRVLGRHPVELLTVLGGDTLVGVVRALGCSALLPRWEALPGVPVSEMVGVEGTLVASKGGGFGDDTFLTRLRDTMSQASRA
jgi:D-threonate/D-erythronate kinase